MTESSAVSALARELRRATTFEDGCAVAIAALREVLDRSLGRGLVARGVVHLRSARGGYRGLVVRELGGGGSAAIAPSATVFRWIERSNGSVAVDLATCLGVTLSGRTPIEIAPAYSAHDAAASIGQMLDRETTHLVAMPLRAAGPVLGMLCLELVWPAQVGAPWPEGEWCAQVEALADVAGPLLLALPHAKAAVDDRDPLIPVVGDRMQPILRILTVFASQDETLLLSGPTGAGKSRLAQLCHARSPRHEAAFATANLLAVPETVQMAELFGWRKGAFTGAHADHEGLIAQAEGGTLFLDEIDKLSLQAQAGLLHVLETRRYTALGGARERDANVRFVVATNGDLPALVRSGAFREDLYYRINVLPIVVPGLDERADEIRGWAEAMLERRQGHAPDAIRFSDEALSLLAAARWPGHLRQLDNVVRRAFALALAEGRTGQIDEACVRRALAFEPRGSGSAMRESAGSLDALASSIVELALAERRAGRTLAMNELDVLRAAALRAAVDRVGSVKDAYLLFGGDALVASRNHAKDYRRLVSALEALETKLGDR